jgi:surface polysaccharide O-acyltransferase-like enzyme
MKQHISSLRIFAIFGVLMIHASAPLVSSFEKNGELAFWIGNLFDGISRWSVPVFFMISGALLLPKQDDFKTFYMKRMSKILIPFVGWSFLYVLYSHFVLHNSGKSIIKTLFDKPFYHLWFVYALLGLYVITPFIQRFLTVCTRSMVAWMIGFWFFNSSVIPLFVKFSGIPVRFHVEMLSSYIGFFLLGYYLETYKPNVPKWFFGAGAIITVVGTYLLTKQNEGNFDGMLYEYASPGVLLMAIGLYGYIQQKNVKLPGSSFLDKHSFGVYLAHPLLLSLLIVKLKLTQIFINPIVGLLLVYIIVCAASYVLVWGISKIPVLKKFI